MEFNTPNSNQTPSPNTLSSPNNPSLTPSDVRCVTQSQEIEPFSNTPDSGPDHQHILNSLCAAEHADNTPHCPSPQAKLSITPVIPSPDRSSIQTNVAAELFKPNPKNKRLKENARNSGAIKANKKRAYVDPSKSLLWFLREIQVDIYASKLQSKFLSTAQKYKPAHEDCRKETNAGRKKNAFAPFEDMKKSLIEGRSMSRNFHRLLLEDFILLKPNVEVMVYINKKQQTSFYSFQKSIVGNPDIL